MRPTVMPVRKAAFSYAMTLLLAAFGGVKTVAKPQPRPRGHFRCSRAIRPAQQRQRTGTAARFTEPNAVAADRSGNLYVADTANFTIRKISSTGVVSTLAGSAGLRGSTDSTGSLARFSIPESVVTDVAGNVYVGDNDTIRRITPAGVVSTFASSAGLSGSVDGVGSAARFTLARGIGIDRTGNLHVADGVDNVIRKITPGAVVSTMDRPD